MSDKQLTQLQYAIDKLKEENFALETGFIHILIYINLSDC